MTGVKASDMLGKGEYEYALPFYGVRRPILIDLVLKPTKKIEESYYSFLEKAERISLSWRRGFHFEVEEGFSLGKASPLYDSKGEIVAPSSRSSDITERERLEDLLPLRVRKSTGSFLRRCRMHIHL